MSGIFISYRRANSATAARLIQGRLGDRAVFVDVASIPLGRDFREEVKKTLDSCDVMLAIVEGNWLPALKNEADWVRLEIETAMRRKIPVIPVLIGDTEMPAKDALPQSMENFAFFNAARLDTASRHFDSEVEELIKAIDDYVGQARASAKEELQTQKTSPRVERELRVPLPKPTGESNAKQARNFGLAEAALAVSALGFFVFVGSSVDFVLKYTAAGYPITAYLTRYYLGGPPGYMLMAPCIYVCNYVFGGPNLWRAKWSDRPTLSKVLRGLARTIEAASWAYGSAITLAFLLPHETADMDAIGAVAFHFIAGSLTIAAAIYLFSYKWRWSKRLRARMFYRSPEGV